MQSRRRRVSGDDDDDDGNGGYQERGRTRSGRRFARANVGHYSTVAELLRHHSRLLELESPISLRYFRVGRDQGSLLQATLRFSTRHQNVRQSLLQHFVTLFRQHNEGPRTGFEVLVTFNAVLGNREGNSFSVFYGHDYRAGNLLGASPELRYGNPYIVRTLADVARLPVNFDFEELANAHRHSFAHSGVRVVRFLNIVYLVYRFVPPARRHRRQ